MTQVQLTVHQDGSWFRVDNQQSVDLHSRARYRVLLQMLVREHLRDPSATISVAAVIREVWPDERLRHTVARNRAYVALCTLRKWGLEGLVLRTQQGYQLDPSLQVNLVDSPRVDEPVAGNDRAQHEGLDLHHEDVASDAVPGAEAFAPESTLVAERTFVEERSMHEHVERADHRVSHSMRVRLVEMPARDDDQPKESLRRLVG